MQTKNMQQALWNTSPERSTSLQMQEHPLVLKDRLSTLFKPREWTSERISKKPSLLPRQSGAGEHGTQDKAGRTKPTQLGEKKAEGDLTAVYNYLTERHQKDRVRVRLFSKEYSDGKKCKGHKLKHGTFQLHIRGKKITKGLVKHWHRLPRGGVYSPSLEMFRIHLDAAPSSTVRLDLFWAGWRSLPT